MPIFGREGKGYLSLCEAHRKGRVFDEKETAKEHAQRHNDKHHGGRAPRVRVFGRELAEVGRPFTRV
jgi:hypothetical protein